MKHNLNICMLGMDFRPNSGGIATHIFELSKALVKAGNFVTVLTINRWNNKLVYIHKIDGIKIISFSKKFDFIHRKISSLFVLIMILPYLFLNVKKFDIFHWHSLKGIEFYVISILKFFFNIKNIWTNHSSYYLEMYRDKKFDYINNILKLPDEIIAPSQELATKSWKNVNFNKDKVSYIFNGVDIEKFAPKEKNKQLLFRLGLKIDTNIILCARRLVDKNGVRFLIQAMPAILKKLPDIKLLVAGDFLGPIEKSDKKFIFDFVKNNNLDKSIILLGNIDNKELVEYYSIADITVLPSLMEAVSISGLESISSGVPIVGSNVGGIPEIIKDGYNGLLTEPKNHNDISEKIIDIFTNRDLDDMKENARKYAEQKFSWYSLVKNVIKKYEKIL